MQFGNIEGTFDHIDFALPVDSELSAQAGVRPNSKEPFEVHVGGTKWSEKLWRGKVYPKDLPETEFLTEYARNFNTIEFGPTFYNIYEVKKINEWRSKVELSPNFKFCPKFPQNITHIRRLKNAEAPTDKFYKSLGGFANQLGPLLLQLGENFSPKCFPDLKAYLETLPFGQRVSLEVRHKEWFSDKGNRQDLFTLLNRLNITWVISDTAGRRDAVHMERTTDTAIIRFLGNNLHATDYVRMDAWVERLKVWRQEGLQSVWFFMHQHDVICVPKGCNYFIEQMNLILDLNIEKPKLL